jgi:hypothetical protein
MAVGRYETSTTFTEKLKLKIQIFVYHRRQPAAKPLLCAVIPFQTDCRAETLVHFPFQCNKTAQRLLACINED